MEKAKELLSHYITMLMEKQGLQVDSDIYYELDLLIDSIVEDVEDRVTKLEKRMKRLEMEGEFNDHS